MPSDSTNYILAIQANNSEGIKAIYTAFLPRISAFILRNGGKEEDAQDVFQDALIILFEKSSAANFELSSSFYTLLYGICRNLWGNRLQKKSRTEVTLNDDIKYIEQSTQLDELMRLEKHKLFWDSFKKLETECQNLLELFFAKKSMIEIAEALGMSSAAYAKKRKFLCKEQLIKLVKSDPRFTSYY